MMTAGEWVNYSEGDDVFGLLRYQLTFTDDGRYGPVNYTARIRGTYRGGTVTKGELDDALGGAQGGRRWCDILEDYLRKKHGLPPADRRSPQQREIDHLRGALAFAASCIKTGMPWTPECERIIDGALKGRTG